MPHNTLQCQYSSTSSENSQSPRVGGLLDLGPEAVFGSLVLGEFLSLNRGGFCIADRLSSFVLGIATYVAQEGVVRDGAEENDRVDFSRAPQEQGEGEMDEGVTKIAVFRASANEERKLLAIHQETVPTWGAGRCSRHLTGSG